MLRLSCRVFDRGGNFLRFDLARYHVQKLGLRNWQEWKEYSRTIRPVYIPSTPQVVYAENWNGMRDWLGLSDLETQADRAVAVEKWRVDGFQNVKVKKTMGAVESLLADLRESCPEIECRYLPYHSTATAVYRIRDVGNPHKNAWMPLKIHLCTASADNDRPRFASRITKEFEGLHIFIVDSSWDLHGGKHYYCFTAREFPKNFLATRCDRLKVSSVKKLTEKLQSHATSSSHKTYQEWSEILMSPTKTGSLSCLGEIIANIFQPLSLEAEHLPIGRGPNLKLGNHEILWRRLTQSDYSYYSHLSHALEGTLIPFDVGDGVEFFLMIVPAGSDEQNSAQGFFFLPSSCLQKYVSAHSNVGKLAIHVYPPFLRPKKKPTRAIQEEQLMYYYDISSEEAVVNSRIKLRNVLAEANTEREKASHKSRENVLGLPVERMSVGM